MTDVIDQAAAREQLNLEQAMQAQREQAKFTPHPKPQGFCLNPLCAEDFGGDLYRLFCGPQCAAEHARRNDQNYF